MPVRFDTVRAMPTHSKVKPQWNPRADLSVNSMGYLVIKVALPAVHKEDLELTVEGQRLTLVGRLLSSIHEETVHGPAKPGPFHLVVEAPAEFDLSKARAAYQKDFLRLVVPRRDAGASAGAK